MLELEAISSNSVMPLLERIPISDVLDTRSSLSIIVIEADIFKVELDETLSRSSVIDSVPATLIVDPPALDTVSLLSVLERLAEIARRDILLNKSSTSVEDADALTNTEEFEETESFASRFDDCPIIEMAAAVDPASLASDIDAVAEMNNLDADDMVSSESVRATTDLITILDADDNTSLASDILNCPIRAITAVEDRASLPSVLIIFAWIVTAEKADRASLASDIDAELLIKTFAVEETTSSNSVVVV